MTGVVAVLAGALLLGILGVLIGVLLSLERTQAEIVATRAGVTDTERRVDRLTGTLVPVLQAAKPLTTDARRGLRQARAALPPLLADARSGIDTARGVLASLPGAAGTAVAISERFRLQLRRQRRLLRRSLDVQNGTRTLNGETVALLRESLAIQREILVHVRSLDEKLGGPLPVR